MLWRSVGRTAGLLWLLAGGCWELLRQRPKTRRERAVWLHTVCSRAMRKMGIAVEVQGHFPERGAVISNHTGYLDIVSFAAMSPCIFVSKAEIRSWPVLGWMTTMAGTIYVERGRGGSAARTTAQIAEAAGARLPVVFFPEGTTTNGTELLPFRSGILYEAMASGEPVTAAYVTYTLGVGNTIETKVENDVAYWGDVVLAKHIFRLLGLRNVAVTVRFAEQPISFSEAARADRKMAAVEAREAVLSLKPGLPMAGELMLAGQERTGL